MLGSFADIRERAEVLTEGFILADFDLVRVFHLEKRPVDHFQYDLYIESGVL